jgi:hypothetical protein
MRFKDEISESRNQVQLKEFDALYKEELDKVLANQNWTENECLTMEMLENGEDLESIRKKANLDEESQKKIADMYFMCLMNSLIRYKNSNPQLKLPFDIPKEEISSWTNNSRNEFAANLKKYEPELQQTSIGRRALDIASEYTTLYESTVGPLPTSSPTSKDTSSAKNTSSTYADKAFDIVDTVGSSLSFLAGVAEGVSLGSRPMYCSTGSTSEAAGFAVGLFARGILEVAKLASSLMI